MNEGMTMQCKEIEALLPFYACEELDEANRIAVAEHLDEFLKANTPAATRRRKIPCWGRCGSLTRSRPWMARF